MLSDNAAKPAEKADYGDFLNTVHNLMNKKHLKLDFENGLFLTMNTNMHDQTTETGQWET